MENARDVDRTINLFFHSTDILLKGVSTMGMLVGSTLDYFNKNSGNHALQKYIGKGGHLEMFSANSRYADSVEKELKAAGVRYVREAGLTPNGEILFVYAKDDRKEVNKDRGEFQKQISLGGITSKEALHYLSGGNVHKIGGLNFYEASMMAEMARQNGVCISIDKTDHDKYQILYPKDNQREMDNIKMTVALQKADPILYDAICKQLDYENNYSMKILQDAMNHETPGARFFGDIEGNRLIISREAVVFTAIDGASMTVSYKDPHREDKIAGLVGGMDNPRELSEDEFLKYEGATPAGRITLIKEADKERPAYTQEELMEMKKFEENRVLYEEKLAHENPEQEIYQYSYLNNEMRMPAFEELEQINAEAIHDRREALDASSPEFYDEARGLYLSYMDEEPDLSYDDQKFAEAILEDEIERAVSEYSWDNETLDVSYDRNANYIPDDLEMDYKE